MGPAMDVMERLVATLEREGAHRLDAPGDEGEPVTAEGLDYVGAKDHWGSVGLVGLSRGDGRTASEVKTIVDGFERLTHELHRYARVLTIFSRYRASSVKLGSFGVLAFVFEHGCPPATAAYVKAQRRGTASKMEYVLCWSIDVPAGTVHDHGMLPRGVFPKKKLIEAALRS